VNDGRTPEPGAILAAAMRRFRACGGIAVGLAAVLVLVLSGCGGSSGSSRHPGKTASTPLVTAPHTVSTGTTPAGTGTLPSGGRTRGGPVPAGTEAASVTFVSPREAFILGTAPCRRQPCSVILRTTDRGAQWVGLPAPDEAVSYRQGSGLWGLRFADADNGYAFGQGLWQTSDGGQAWRKLTPPAPSVLSLEAVQDREIVAFAQSCQPVRGCSGRLGLYHEPIGGSWSRVNSTRTFASDASFAVHGATVWALAGPRLYISQNGGASFAGAPMPCASNRSTGGRQPTSITDDGTHVYLLCTGGAFTGHTIKYVYATSGPGSPWSLVGKPPTEGDGGQISAGADDSIVIATYSAASLLYHSTDGGHTWSTVVTEDDGGAGWNDLGFTTATDGVVVHAPPVPGQKRPGQLLLTDDGGLTWHTVSFQSAG
jgi:photosystem II stability/assembly factor-like uncharacterized protein